MRHEIELIRGAASSNLGGKMPEMALLLVSLIEISNLSLKHY